EVGIRMPVAHQELLDAQGPGGIPGPDQHGIAEAMLDERQAAEQEGAHEDLAELAVDLHERPEALAIELDHLSGFGRADVAERGATREHGDLAGELARGKNRDEFLSLAARTDELEATGGDDEEAFGLSPGFLEHFTLLNRANAAVRRDARDLLRRQCREGVFDI